MVVLQNGWFEMEHPTKMDHLGIRPMYGNLYLILWHQFSYPCRIYSIVPICSVSPCSHFVSMCCFNTQTHVLCESMNMRHIHMPLSSQLSMLSVWNQPSKLWQSHIWFMIGYVYLCITWSIKPFNLSVCNSCLGCDKSMFAYNSGLA